MVFSPDRAERLDPPRFQLRLPRRFTVLRGAAVAALLCLAAGALLIEQPRPVPIPVAAAPAPSVSPSAPAAPPGFVGLPLRLADSGVVTVVRAGQRIDVLASDGSRPAQLLATDVLVLRATARGEVPEDGALLYLAVTRDQAARLAGFTTEAHLTVTVRSP